MAFIREFLKSGVLSTMRKTFSHYLQIHFDGARLSGGVVIGFRDKTKGGMNKLSEELY